MPRSQWAPPDVLIVLLLAKDHAKVYVLAIVPTVVLALAQVLVQEIVQAYVAMDAMAPTQA